GKTQQEIADNFGVHLNTVGNWWRSYQKEGKKALHVNKRGLKSGQGRVLTAEQEKEIQQMIIDKTPDQLKLPFVLWDRKAVKELIQSQYGVNVAIRTIGDYLLRWNFSPQRPVKRAYEQQPKAVRRWLDEVYPEIQIKAKQEDAEIHWGDETGFRNDHHYGRGYSPRGKTPVVHLSAKRVSTNMISSITNQGKVRFMIYSKSMNAQVLIKFLKRLIKSSDRKIFLILDNLKVHHAIHVREWLEGKEDELEIFFLPSYSPELNPDEYLNNDIKQGIHSKTLFRDEKSLKKGVLSHMRMLQKMPKRVMNYFKHPKIAYAR
ncbi:MAG: IS630 family transposase, partial [bacterium]